MNKIKISNKDDRILYCAYGSNLSIEQMAIRCPNSVPFGKGVILDYKLEMRAHADITACKGDYTPVGLWLIDKKDLPYLDIYEGYPNYYTKHNVKVRVDSLYDEKKKEFIDLNFNDVYVTNTLVYEMTEFNKDREGYPMGSYINTILDGYRDFEIADYTKLDKSLSDVKYYYVS